MDIKLWEFFDSPKKWLKCALASTDEANEDHYASSSFSTCGATHPAAVSFCIRGAIIKIHGVVSAARIEAKIEHRLKVSDIVDWNNDPELTFEVFHKRLKDADV